MLVNDNHRIPILAVALSKFLGNGGRLSFGVFGI
jgi:hypothetical protein